jgi:predicted Fe-Mo cluster-binding NifX family protein
MKIAIASNHGRISEHFGYCESFTIFDIENGKIVSEKVIPNPGHKPGFLPNLLHSLQVNVIITGGIGSGAIELFSSNGIEVVSGVCGTATQAASDYLQGKLVSSGAVCHQHQHRGNCD